MNFLPLEFWLTFDNFEKWEPHHSYCLTNLMSFFMSLDLMFEPFRFFFIIKIKKNVIYIKKKRHLLFEKYGTKTAF